MKVKASLFAVRAKLGKYVGIPYEELDCQAFVERVLRDCGVKRNWRGSNDMWRNAVHSHTELNDLNSVPKGAWLFTIKHDGKEDKQRYTDGVNAAHVGIYLGDGEVIHSTTGGVQWDKISSERWTHYALANDLDYDTNDKELTLHDMITAIYNKLCKETYHES